MMETIKKYKNVLIGMATLLLLFIVYSFFFAGGGPPTTSPLSTVEQGATPGEDLVPLLQRLQSIKLDASVLASPVFLSLKDFGQTIPPQPVGRPNPFAPLPN